MPSLIESSIGMPLFDRTRRPLQPTQAGEVYIDMIKQMQELKFDLKRQMQDIRDLNTGDLRQQTPSATTFYRILPWSDLLQVPAGYAVKDNIRISDTVSV